MIVTGASAGVGRALVRELSKYQMSIGLIARNEERLKQALDEVEEAGSRGLIALSDVADHEQLFQAAEKIHAHFGGIDIWINNAMATVFGPVHKIRPEEFKRVTEVTYLGTVYGTLAALKYMRPKDQGTIIQIGSALAYRSIPLQAPYCAAKHAIAGFTDSLRCELLHDHSRIELCTAHLPGINTPQFSWARVKIDKFPQPVPPIFQPEYIAEKVIDLILHPKREKWIGFPTFKTIIGQKFFPGIAESYLAKKGYQSQFSQYQLQENRDDNLYQTSHMNYAAHGEFDQQAKG